MAVLREVSGGREHPLEKATVLIGRAPGCDIILASPRVSGRHASLTQNGTEWSIEDHGSSNGTFVNGRRIQEKTRLRAGDRIELYDITLLFHETPQVKMVDAPTAQVQQSVLTALAVAAGSRTGVAPEAKLQEIGRAHV